MPLTYAPFAASTVLDEVVKKKVALRQGSRGPAVALLQGALIDLGIKMPRSTSKTGAPDGIFGFETYKAITAFQAKHGAVDDGIVGATTLGLVDSVMAKKAKPAPHVPPPKLPPPILGDYKIGVGDPPITPDPGAGIWNSTPTQVTYVALKASILQVLPPAYLIIGDDATKHMAHYLGCSGKDYTIDVDGMVADVPSARRRYEDEVSQAKLFVETLGPGRYDITSVKPQGGYNRQRENTNWYFAIGGYSTWGVGQATVGSSPAGRQYVLEFEYRFFDRYNWDAGKSVKIVGIKVTDEFMAEFHRQGLAQEFNCLGSFKRRFTWNQGDAIPKAQLDAPAGRS